MIAHIVCWPKDMAVMNLFNFNRCREMHKNLCSVFCQLTFPSPTFITMAAMFTTSLNLYFGVIRRFTDCGKTAKRRMDHELLRSASSGGTSTIRIIC